MFNSNSALQRAEMVEAEIVHWDIRNNAAWLKRILFFDKTYILILVVTSIIQT